MPQLKSSFARLSHTDPGQLDSLSQRLRRIDFELGEGNKVIAIDKRANELTLQVVARRIRDARHFDLEAGKFVAERVPSDRELYFNIDFASGITSTPGGKRDFGTLLELMRKAGAGRDLEALPIVIDLLAWLKAVLKMYESAQPGQFVLDGLYMEPRMIGRFSAKPVDNRLDLDYLTQHAAQLRSMRLGLFHEGARRTVEARADATLSISSSDEEDAEHFFDEQRRLLLSNEIAERASSDAL